MSIKKQIASIIALWYKTELRGSAIQQQKSDLTSSVLTLLSNHMNQTSQLNPMNLFPL